MTMAVETSNELDEIDRKILNSLQYDFSVMERPFLDIAKKLDSTEEEILFRAERLYVKQIIRRLGASINSCQVGYISTLVALKVADERLSEVAKVVNSFPGVTHNYLRDGDYNMWFTAIAQDEDSLNGILSTVKATNGVKKLMSLPAKQVFKVSVQFPLVVR